MYLSDTTIKKLLRSKHLGIDPYDENSLDPVSYELHLSDELTKVTPEKEKDYFMGMSPRSKTTTSVQIGDDGYLLKPGEFILGKTVEALSISEGYAGIYDGKASLAQIGLFTHVSSIHIEPGENMRITPEMHNCSGHSILLEVGMKIGQVIFVEVK